ncbi:MAG: ribosome maturation factor RimM [Sterolibacterium sp.]|nr:ribosome maturation factor RimM [Sterolibacterium sp.]
MIVLGRIVGTYGLRGWVKLHPMGDDFNALGEMPQWWLGPVADGEVWTPYAIHALKAHGKGWVVKFAGVDDCNAAQTIDGNYVAAPREALPMTGADEYYWADLVGLEVVNGKGERLGKVAGLLSTGAHEVLCVRDAEGKNERLLPFVAQVVKNVDRANGTICVEWGADW